MPGSWARKTSERIPQTQRGLRGVYLSDMPSAKPIIRRRRIKGLAGLSGGDPDYAPGGGTWHEVERPR